MSGKRRVLVVSSGRADYSFLTPVIKAIGEHKDLELKVMATGGHHDKSIGYTRKMFDDDNIKVDYDLVCYSEDKSRDDYFFWLIDMCEMFYNSLKIVKPDLVVLLGDRVEIFGVAVACCMSCVPIVHLQGGDTSGGHDDIFRDMITRMSFIHFPATERSAMNVFNIMNGVMRRNIGGIK